MAIKGLGLGGAEQLIAGGARYWNRESFEYHVAYSLPWKDQLVPELVSAQVPVHLVGGKRGLTPLSSRRLKNLIQEVGADLVHAHLPLMGVSARLVSPAPVVYTEHNLAHSYRLPTRAANYATYGRNAAVIAVSDQVAESVSGYPGPEPVVVRNGVETVDPYETHGVRGELGIPTGTDLVVHVGNIRPHKGHETLINAVKLVKEAKPDIRVVSIGAEKKQGDLSRVRSLARSKGVSDVISFEGRRADARRFIEVADVLVNPSDAEGLPLVVLEAMASGTPVVATSVGGVPSVIEDDITGRIVEPGDPEALGRAILDVLDNRDKAKRYSTAARALIEKRHGIEAMIKAYETIYRNVLGV